MSRSSRPSRRPSLRRRRRVLVATSLTLAGLAAVGHGGGTDPGSPATPVDFNTTIRPILARNCFLCHGPDVSTRKAGLRLDTRDHALAATRRNGPPAIVPGDADASLLVRRLESRDDDFRMPLAPRPRLTTEQITAIRRWIDEGATYAVHWSWAPVADAPPPDVDDPAWAPHPVDRFVYAAMREQGLAPAGEADKATLARRLHFDLLGLPPTANDVDAFLADDRPDAWERLVDRLLDSPHYGERWARHWLDLVRYAETHGHEFDYPIRYAWQYRDYLIRALNADVPYDELVTEHLAGDLLVSPRRHPTEEYNESIIGTGFWFLSQGTHGPVDVRADEAERIANQIDVLSKSFLGITVSCARCHDHKFDAISTADFYGLAGFLQSSRRQDAYLDPSRRIRTTLEGTETLIRQADPLVALILPVRGARLDHVRQTARYAEAAGGALRAAGLPPSTSTPDEDYPDPFLAPGLSAVAVARDLEPDRLERWVVALQAPLHGAHPIAPLRRAILDGSTTGIADPAEDPGPAEPSAVVFESFDTLDEWFATGHAFDTALIEPGQVVPTAAGARLVAPGIVHSGRLGRRLQGTIRSRTFPIESEYIVYRVSGRGARVRLIIDGYFLDEFNALLFEGMTFPVDVGDDAWLDHAQPVGRYRGHRAYIEIIDDGDGFVAVDEIVFSDAAPPAAAPAPSATVAARRLEEATIEALAAWSDGTIGGRGAAVLNWMLEHELFDLDDAPVRAAMSRLAERTAPVVRIDESRPRPMRVLAIADGTGEDEVVFVRGSHRTPGGVVPRRFLESLSPGAQPPVTSGSGRLHLAERLLAPENPLPARVAVNRVWLHLFGTGLVPTPDNFGALGQPPSHPELLDWLATWYRDDAGWSTKQLIRLLVTSRTYRLASEANDPTTLEHDPTNRFLSRALVRRLEGEAIRDATLAVSGGLDETMYGAPVPMHLTPFLTGRGRPGKSGPLDGDGRRSIYLEVRRNFRTPIMAIFDTPVPASTVGRRNRSNVPAQALMMMNDEFVAEQSRHWARRVLEAESDSTRARIETMYRQAFARLPSPDEQAAALDFLRRQAQTRDVGDGKNDETVWADFAHVLFNTKEFIFLP